MIRDAEKLILPGVGAFDAAMRKFHETGLVPVVGELVLEKKIPVLGLCVGLQLMTKGSEEGQLAGLGLVRCGYDPLQIRRGACPSQSPAHGLE